MTQPWEHPAVDAAIRAHALAAYPREACGVIKGGEYIRCRNTASDPETAFRISPRRWARLLPVQAVVHSHPDGPDCPSAADMRGQQAMVLPWVIVSTDGTGCLPPFAFGDQVARPPLVGRGFRHGVTDCFSLVRDWYAQERGIVLPDRPRDWEWWNKGGDLYRDGFAKLGFARLPEGAAPEPGDGFLAQVPKVKVPCHGGIYLGNGMGLHHLTADKPADESRLSSTFPLARWQNYITHWLRYEG